MSNLYRLTFNLTIPEHEDHEREVVRSAVSDVLAVVDERCIVEGHRMLRLASGPNVFLADVDFLAANDAEAEFFVGRVQRMTGIPPVDAVKVSLVKRDA